MKRYTRVEGFLKEDIDGHWMAHKDHLAIVEKLKAEISSLREEVASLQEEVETLTYRIGF